MTKVSLGILPFLFSSISAASAEGPLSAYDATYKLIGPMGTAIMREASDGKSHALRENTAANGNKDIVLMDFDKRTITVLIPRTKIAIPTAMSTSNHDLVTDDSFTNKPGAKSLGAKTIDDHPCHGWEVSDKSSKQTFWMGDDIKCLVYSESSNGLDKVTMSLQSWSNQPPQASEFEVPSDYKITPFSKASPEIQPANPEMDRVRQYIEDNKPQQAVDLLTKMLAGETKDKTFMLVVRGGILYRSLGKRDEALKDFNDCIEIDPSCFQAYKRRGEYFAYYDQPDKALADFNKCLALAPEYGDVYVWRASIYLLQNKLKDAFADLDSAEKFNAKNTSMLKRIRELCTIAAEQKKGGKKSRKK